MLAQKTRNPATSNRYRPRTPILEERWICHMIALETYPILLSQSQSTSGLVGQAQLCVSMARIETQSISSIGDAVCRCRSTTRLGCIAILLLEALDAGAKCGSTVCMPAGRRRIPLRQCDRGPLLMPSRGGVEQVLVREFGMH
jgi:hypothetical protein